MLTSRRLIFLAVMLRTSFVVGLLGASSALAQNTLLPANLKITPPDPTLPPRVASFLGKWVGKWDNVLDSTLVVRHIHPANAKGVYKAEVIYSYGTYTPWSITTAGYREENAEIKDGRLSIQLGMVTITYKTTDDPTTLAGVYSLRGSAYAGAFRKVE